MCGGTIFHRNIWSLSKCSESCKSIASNHNFFVSNALYVRNLLQVITKYHNCSTNIVLWTCARQSAPTVHAHRPRMYFTSVPEFCPRPHIHAQRLDLFARCLWLTPKSCSRSCPFPLVPAVVPVGARYTTVDSHLRLPTATLAGNSKKSYYSKVNLE